MVFKGAQLIGLYSFDGRNKNNIEASCSNGSVIVVAFDSGDMIITSEQSNEAISSFKSHYGNVSSINYFEKFDCVITVERNSLRRDESSQFFMCCYFCISGTTNPNQNLVKSLTVPLAGEASNIGICDKSGSIVLAIGNNITFWAISDDKESIKNLLEIDLSDALLGCNAMQSKIRFVSLCDSLISICTESLLIVAALSDSKHEKSVKINISKQNRKMVISKSKFVKSEEKNELSQLLSNIPRGKIDDSDILADIYFEEKNDFDTDNSPSSTCLTRLEDDFPAIENKSKNQEANEIFNKDDNWIDPWLGSIRTPVHANLNINTPSHVGACKIVMVRRCNIREEIVYLKVVRGSHSAQIQNNQLSVIVGTPISTYLYDFYFENSNRCPKLSKVETRCRVNFAGKKVFDIEYSNGILFALNEIGIETWSIQYNFQKNCIQSYSKRNLELMDVYSNWEISTSVSPCLLSMKQLNYKNFVPKSLPSNILQARNGLIILPSNFGDSRHFIECKSTRLKQRFVSECEYFEAEKSQDVVYAIWRSEFCHTEKFSGGLIALKLNLEFPLSLFARVKHEIDRTFKVKKENMEILKGFLGITKAVYGMLSKEADALWNVLGQSKSEVTSLATLNAYVTHRIKGTNCASIVAELHLKCFKLAQNPFGSNGAIQNFSMACNWLLLGDRSINVVVSELCGAIGNKKTNETKETKKNDDIPNPLFGIFGGKKNEVPEKDDDSPNISVELKAQLMHKFIEPAFMSPHSLGCAHTKLKFVDSKEDYEKLDQSLVSLVDFLDNASAVRFVNYALDNVWKNLPMFRKKLAEILSESEDSSDEVLLAKTLLSCYEKSETAEISKFDKISEQLLEQVCIENHSLLISQRRNEVSLGPLGSLLLKANRLDALISAFVLLTVPWHASKINQLQALDMRAMSASLVETELNPIDVLCLMGLSGQKTCLAFCEKINAEAPVFCSNDENRETANSMEKEMFKLFLSKRTAHKVFENVPDPSYLVLKGLSPWKEGFRRNAVMEDVLKEELGNFYLESLKTMQTTENELPMAHFTSENENYYLPKWVLELGKIIFGDIELLMENHQLKVGPHLSRLLSLDFGTLNSIFSKAEAFEQKKFEQRSMSEYVGAVISAACLGCGGDPERGIEYLCSLSKCSAMIVDYVQFVCGQDESRWSRALGCIRSIDVSESIRDDVMEHMAVVLPTSSYLKVFPDNIGVLRCISGLEKNLGLVK